MMSDIVIDPNKEFIGRRLRSIFKSIREAETGPDQKTFGFEHRLKEIGQQYNDVLSKAKELFPGNKYLPENEKAIDWVLKKSGTSGLAEYLKSNIRTIADALDIPLEHPLASYNENSSNNPAVIVDARTNVSQSNVQTVESTIDNINSLKLDQSKTEEIIKLVKDFEEESKANKDPSKLKEIFKKVAGISVQAASFLLVHAKELGVLALLF